MSAPRPTTYNVPHPAWIEVDLAQFRRNLAAIRARIGTSLLCCVVKANAYGHGIVPIAKAAAEVDYFGVAHLKEGAVLREAGIDKPILVLGAIHEDQIEDLIRYRLEFTVSSAYKAELVAKKAEEMGLRCLVHLEVDTGMRRTGVRSETAVRLIEQLLGHTALRLNGVYSHFVMSETVNDTSIRQIEEFRKLRERFQGTPLCWHLANSGGVLNYPDSHLDLVRPGLLCYGFFSSGVLPILSLKARLSYFKVVDAGQGISYGHTYTTARQTRVVTVPVGYGDGFRRKGGDVLIRGKRYPIAGKVCMDQFMVDIGWDEAYVGDEAVLIGRQGEEEKSLEELAASLGVDPREALCSLNDRIPRIYRE